MQGNDDTVFRTLVETATYGICVFADDVRLFVNQAYVDQHGFETIEHGLTSDANVGADQAEMLEWDKIKDHLDEVPPFRFRVNQLDGTSKILEATYARITYAGAPAWVSTTRDVTENDRSRRELRTSEARFRELFELAPVGIAIADANRITLDANPAFAAMLGVSVDQVIGRRMRDFGRTGVPQRLEAYEQMIAGEAESVTGDRELVRADGSPLFVHMISIPVRNEDGDFLYALRVFEDTTEAENMKRAQGEFVAVTSHELRTPLTAIHAAVTLVSSGAYGELPEAAQRLLEIASENSGRMIQLTTDLIDIERMDLGKLTLYVVPSDAADLVERARDSVAPLADEAGVAIVVEALPTSLPADQTRVTQVLTNLLTNAIKFSEAGSTIRVQAGSDGMVVRFSVSDEGQGILEDQLSKVFDRFHQVDASDTRARGGWGLGLAVAKAIVEQHGGAIWAESEPGNGSTFNFELPSSLA
jgi:PAS domain S-box-containing protein